MSSQIGDVEARARVLLGSLPLEVRTSLRGLIDHVGRTVGAPVQIDMFGDESWENVAAFFVQTDDAVSIMLRSTDSGFRKAFAVAHELAHLLLEHPTCLALKEQLRPRYGDVKLCRSRPLSLDDLTPEERVYEEEAETVARLLVAGWRSPIDDHAERVLR